MNMIYAFHVLAVGTALAACSVSIRAAPDTKSKWPESVQLRASLLPGYAKAQTHCLACHSAEYITSQPPNVGRPYWEAITRRMKLVFKAPINDDDIPAIVDYLTVTNSTQGP